MVNGGTTGISLAEKEMALENNLFASTPGFGKTQRMPLHDALFS